MRTFRKLFSKPAPAPRQRPITVTREELRERAARMLFEKEWRCQTCGARLKIKATEDRVNGPSNFEAHPAGHPHAGSATRRSSELTWDGLAEERGWDVDPVKCPACKAGLTIEEYKAYRRARGL